MTSYSYSKKDDDVVHAMVVTSQKFINLMGKDLTNHFWKYRVSLLNMIPAQTFGPDAVTLVLAGKHEDIKKCLDQLKKICYEKEVGIETVPVRSLPPVLKGYLSDMEDNFKFEKIFDFCSKDYLEFCKKHNINPHPEVVEKI